MTGSATSAAAATKAFFIRYSLGAENSRRTVPDTGEPKPPSTERACPLFRHVWHAGHSAAVQMKVRRDSAIVLDRQQTASRTACRRACSDALCRSPASPANDTPCAGSHCEACVLGDRCRGTAPAGTLISCVSENRTPYRTPRWRSRRCRPSMPIIATFCPLSASRLQPILLDRTASDRYRQDL